MVKKDGRSLVGLEMTIPELVKCLDLNVDPQHGSGKGAVPQARAAIEAALTLPSDKRSP
jgi:hypothetical protein